MAPGAMMADVENRSRHFVKQHVVPLESGLNTRVLAEIDNKFRQILNSIVRVTMLGTSGLGIADHQKKSEFWSPCLSRAGPEMGRNVSSSVLSSNRSRFPILGGTRAMNVRTAIAITLLVLLLAASLGNLYTCIVRFSGNSAFAPHSTFVQVARLGLNAFKRADDDRAIVAFDELIRLDPDHSEAH